MQVNDPYVLLQNALRAHLAGVLVHSSISSNNIVCYYYYLTLKLQKVWIV